MLRRVVVIGLAIVGSSALLAGCGSSKSVPNVGSARVEALSYVPQDVPLVALVATDLERGQGAVAKGLVGRFPGSALVLAQLESKLESRTGLSFDDLRPLLGNEIVIAV